MAQAIAAFQAWRPDFIWMDMRMPVLDGYAATQRIRALPGGDAVKIVAVTASVLAEEQDDILAAGCDDTVRKPFHDYEIFEAMARHLGVEYRYEEAEGTPSQVQRTDITVEMLAALPADLREELRDTTLTLDREAALSVIARIADQAPATAAGGARTGG